MKDKPHEHPIQECRSGLCAWAINIASLQEIIAGRQSLRCAIPELPCQIIDREMDEAEFLIESNT